MLQKLISNVDQTPTTWTRICGLKPRKAIIPKLLKVIVVFFRYVEEVKLFTLRDRIMLTNVGNTIL